MSEPRFKDALTREQIGEAYQTLMSEVRIRLAALQESLDLAKADSGNEGNWKAVEFCYLQIRKICELVAISVLVAHNEFAEFRTNAMLKEWNADALFARILAENGLAFPLPAILHPNKNGPGFHHIEPNFDGPKAQDLKSIYNGCGSHLHIGSLKSLLADSKKKLDIDELREWNNALVTLLNQHLLFLPDIRSVMFITMMEGASGAVNVTFGEADGPAVFQPGDNVIRFENPNNG